MQKPMRTAGAPTGAATGAATGAEARAAMAPPLWGASLPPLAPVPSPPDGAPSASVPRAMNPAQRLYGAGPEGATCATCVYLTHQGYQSRAYYKCALRGATRGEGSDQRIGWPACGRYRLRDTARDTAPDTARDAAEATPAGHRYPDDWYRGLPTLYRETGANTLRCPHCGLLLAFRTLQRGHPITYGITSQEEYLQEAARCSARPATRAVATRAVATR